METQEQLAERINEAAELVGLGASYAHFKSPEQTYKVIALALREEDAEPMVVYQAEYGAKITFIRPVKSWTEQVKLNGKKLKRFTKL